MRCANCGATIAPGPGGPARCEYCGAEAAGPARPAVGPELRAGPLAGPEPGPARLEGPERGWKPVFRLALLILGFLGLVAFFVTMQLCTAGRLADP